MHSACLNRIFTVAGFLGTAASHKLQYSTTQMDQHTDQCMNWSGIRKLPQQLLSRYEERYDAQILLASCHSELTNRCKETFLLRQRLMWWNETRALTHAPLWPVNILRSKLKRLASSRVSVRPRSCIADIRVTPMLLFNNKPSTVTRCGI